MINTATFTALMDNKDFVLKMLSQETAGDVQKLFAENGVDISMDEVNELGRQLEKQTCADDGLSEDALESVSGGIAAETAALIWAGVKCATAVGGAALAIYKWYKSR